MNFQINGEALVIEINQLLAGLTVEELFNRYHSGKKLIHEFRMSSRVFINGEAVKQNFNTLLNAGDKLSVPVFTKETPDFIPQDIPVEIVYEDDFVLVVNKPEGMLVHPDEKGGLGTLANAVASYYVKTGQSHRIRYIHRLDTETTGGVVFVKNAFTHSLYDYLLSTKTIKRRYLAIVTGRLPKKEGLIDAPIGRDRHDKQKRIVSETGESALTRYKVLKTLKCGTLIEAQLETGRTHQIRVHMSYLNCPILGDLLYGKPSPFIGRQALHAYKLELLHPVTLEPFTVEIPLPKDMEHLSK